MLSIYFSNSLNDFFFSRAGATYTSEIIKIKHVKLLQGSENTLLKPPKQAHGHIQLKAAQVFWTPAHPRSSLTPACEGEECNTGSA